MNMISMRAAATPAWPAVLLATALAACGGGAGDQDPILGGPALSNGGPAYAVPTITAVSPTPNAPAVAINTRLVTATFSQPMVLSTLRAAFSLSCTASPPVPGVVSYSATTQTAVFTLQTGYSLPPNTPCVATISTAAQSAKAKALAADFSWRWTTASTPDITPPTVTGTIHRDGAIEVPTNTQIGATFSEAMDIPSVSATNFLVRQTANGSPVAGSLALSGNNVVFRPATGLLSGTQYSVTVKGSAGGVSDVAGNAMANDFLWSWTTAGTPDETSPTVASTNPFDAAVGVCINKTVNATFSEPMDPLSINNSTFTLSVTGGAAISGLVSYAAQTRIASFNPATNLVGLPPTRYTATLKGGANGVKDLAGNPLVADKVLRFTTNASTCVAAPVLGAVTPFGAFSGSASDFLTNDGLNTLINGDVGADAPSTKVTGLRDAGGVNYAVTGNNAGTVNGTVYTQGTPVGGSAVVTQVYGNALAAYNSISPANLSGGLDVSDTAQCPSCGGLAQGRDQLGGRTLPPGIYASATGSYGIGVTTLTADSLTLDAGGDPHAVWIFQTAPVSGALTVGVTGPASPAVPVQVLLINGAMAKNVFWYLPAGATIGTGSTMAGTLLAGAAITVSTTGGSPPTAVLTRLLGRAISLAGGMTMTNTIIDVPAP